MHIEYVLANRRWHLGDEYTINFWTDKWLPYTLVDSLQIPHNLRHLLQAKLRDFILNDSWNIPQVLLDRYPFLQADIDKIFIPQIPHSGELIWETADSGILSLKEAYNIMHHPGSTISWCKLLWCRAVPPSRSF